MSSTTRYPSALAATVLVLIATAACGAAGDEGLSASALAGNGSPISVVNGETQAIYTYTDAVRETVFVEAPIDSDGDGVLDRIAVDIVRPNTPDGVKLSTVMEASPYYKVPATHSTLQVPGPPTPLGFQHWYDEFFVARGYAAVEVEMQGTARSTGCPTTGGKDDTASVVAVIDWLNGRASAVHQDGSAAVASWSGGSVGMIGVSYNGTLPIAVATQGVVGLKTIVPIGAISSWYDYARDAGIGYAGWDNRYPEDLANFVVAPGQATRCAAVLKELGDDAADDSFDYTPFWEERDYRKNLGKITASVFTVHGLHDENVKRHNFARFWYGISALNVPRKIWLHNEGHVDPISVRSPEWKVAMHHWMDHWLYGVDNGVMNEPMASIERPDGSWEDHAGWPEPGTQSQSFYPTTTGALANSPLAAPAVQPMTDDPTQGEYEQVTDPATTKAFRLAFVGQPLTAPVRIAGTPRVHVVAQIDSTSTPLTGILMDYGTASVPTPRNSTITELMGACTLADVDARTGCAAPGIPQFATLDFQIVTRGSVDVKNRLSLAESKPLTPGESYEVEWDLQPQDHIFAVGHQIGLVIAANDPSYVATDHLAGSMSVQLDKTSFILPVAPATR